jgi:hypothetical protein
MFREQRRQYRGNVKKGIDNAESRRKRNDVTIELRKKNREEQMQKRRMAASDNQNVNDENANSLNVNQNSQSGYQTNSLPKLSKHDIKDRLRNIQQLVNGVNGNDPAERLRSTIEFRRMLSVEDCPPIEDVIKSGVVPRLMQFLSYNNEQKLQFEAAWTITNIASGTTAHTKCVVEHGGISCFVNLLRSPNAEVREQAVWALGNIAGDSPEYRDLVLKTGNSMQRLITILTNEQTSPKLTMIRNATWCMSNFCRGKPKPKFDQIRACVPVLAKLLLQNDPEVLTDSCWALSYVTDDQTQGNQKIQAVIEQQGICERLIYLLQHGTNAVQVPALRTIGNIVTGDDAQTQAMLLPNPLPALLGTLTCQRKSLRKETCWTVSNMTAGTPQQIQLVIDANLVPPLVNVLKEDQFDVQKEAAWAISNITSGGTENHIRFLVSQAAIPAMCGMLKCGDVKMIMVVLDALDNILKIGRKDAKVTEDNQYSDLVEECGGLDTLEDLQRHENEEIYEKSVRLLQEYFESEEDDGMGMAPEVDQNTGQFAFGQQFGATQQTPQFAF